MTDPVFTIFIPTYNRGHLLPRPLASIETQTFHSFEVIIVDDGSTDDTRAIVEEWKTRVSFPVFYFWQENQGRHVAHNTAITNARGTLFVTLDSDDRLVPTALERMHYHWERIAIQDRPDFAGVEGLCAHIADGRIAGHRYPKEVMDSDAISIRRQHHVGGDKKGAIRTDVLQKFPFPTFSGERHIPPSLVFKRIAQRYKTRYFNEVVQEIEYQPDGLSADRFRLRMRNPRGFRYYFMEEVNVHGTGDPLGERLRSCAKYVRYSLHSGSSLVQQIKDINFPILWLISFPRGILSWVADRVRMRTRHIA